MEDLQIQRTPQYNSKKKILNQNIIQKHNIEHNYNVKQIFYYNHYQILDNKFNLILK